MKDSILLITTIVYAVALTQPNALAFRSISGVQATNTIEHKLSSIAGLKAVPSSGIIDYIGRTVPTDSTLPRWSTDEMVFKPQTDKELFQTKLGLFRQYPWKRIRGKVILKAKISGSLPLESSSGGGFGFGGSPDLEPVDSLSDLQNLFSYASKDPRVQAVVLEIGKDPMQRPQFNLFSLRNFLKLLHFKYFLLNLNCVLQTFDRLVNLQVLLLLKQKGNVDLHLTYELCRQSQLWLCKITGSSPLNGILSSIWEKDYWILQWRG